MYVSQRWMVLLLGLGLAVALSGCSTTKLVDHWQADSFHRGDLDSVLVVAATNNPTNRILFETEIQRALQSKGVEAITSFNAIGDATPKKEAVEAYVKSGKVNYVVATRLSNMEIEKDHIPPQVRTYYTGPYYPSLGHYYGAYGGDTVTLTRDAYVDTRRTAVLVTTIFDTRSGEPVWVGRSESFEPSSVISLAREVARASAHAIAR